MSFQEVESRSRIGIMLPFEVVCSLETSEKEKLFDSLLRECERDLKNEITSLDNYSMRK